MENFTVHYFAKKYAEWQNPEIAKKETQTQDDWRVMDRAKYDFYAMAFDVATIALVASVVAFFFTGSLICLIAAYIMNATREAFAKGIRFYEDNARQFDRPEVSQNLLCLVDLASEANKNWSNEFRILDFVAWKYTLPKPPKAEVVPVPANVAPPAMESAPANMNESISLSSSSSSSSYHSPVRHYTHTSRVSIGHPTTSPGNYNDNWISPEQQ